LTLRHYYADDIAAIDFLSFHYDIFSAFRHAIAISPLTADY
jgi:hypothetical protein